MEFNCMNFSFYDDCIYSIKILIGLLERNWWHPQQKSVICLFYPVMPFTRIFHFL